MYIFILKLFVACCAIFFSWASLEADQAHEQEVYYFFAYGGYLNNQIVQGDLGYSPENMGVYRLDDYEFAYNRAPAGRNSTGGNIHPSKGKAVYGVVWKLQARDMAILDREEMTPEVYQRHKVKVVNAANQNESRYVEAFMATPKYLSKSCFPRRLYVDIVTKGAKEQGLPQKYIKEYLNWNGPWGSDF